MSFSFSLDSNPYAVTEDPDQLQIVRIPSRLALLQRIPVDVGVTGDEPPDRLRVLVRSEGDNLPGTNLRVRVTDLDSVDLVRPQTITPDVLDFPREWKWVEVPLVPTVGWGAGPTIDVLVWFSAVERGLGWEVATPNTGERVRSWRGPVDSVTPSRPVFGSRLTFPRAAAVFSRVSGTLLEPEVGGAGAATVGAGSVFVGSSAGGSGFRQFVSRQYSTTLAQQCVVEANNHVYYGTSGSSSLPARIRKVRKSDMAGVTQLTTSVTDDLGSATRSGQFGFFVSRSGLIGKYNLNDNTTANPTLVAVAAGPPSNAVVNDTNHIYVGTTQSPARIYKFAIAHTGFQLTLVGQITLSANEDIIADMVVSPDETRLYAVTQSRRVVEINLTNFTRTRARNLGATPQLLRTVDITPDGASLLVGTFDGRVLRLDTTVPTGSDPDFPTTGRADLASDLVMSVKVDRAGVAAYAVSLFDPATVHRILVNDPAFEMPVVGVFDLPANFGATFDFAMNDRTMYLVNGSSNPSLIGKLETSGTLISRVNQFSLSSTVVAEIPYFDSEIPLAILRDTTNQTTTVLAADPRSRLTRYNDSGGFPTHSNTLPERPTTFVADANNIFTLLDSPGAAGPAVRKHDLSTLAPVGSDLQFQAGESNPSCVTATANHLYVGTNSAPGRVVKVQKSDNTRLGAVTLNLNENFLAAAVNDGTHAYFVTKQTRARVIKVNMNDGGTSAPTRVGAITLEPGEGSGIAAVIEGGALYVLTDARPAQVIKIDLATFTRETAVTFAGNETIGRSLVADSGRLYAATNPFVTRVVRLGDSLASTGTSYALQINTRADLTLNSQVIRRDADVAVQLGRVPSPPVDLSATVVDPTGADGCVTGVEVSWGMPDDECATVQDGGYVEVQRRFGNRPWVTTHLVENDSTRTVVDVEMARNTNNFYRLRLVNDAGFSSQWVSTEPVETVSDCCGYQFGTNLRPTATVWYDDIGDRSYRFPEQVSFIEFEGVDGSTPLRTDSDRLDDFDVQLMVAGFGVAGGTTNTAELEQVGRRLFSPLLILVGNKRDDLGVLFRPPHITVSDDKGNVWVAQVDTREGSTTANAGRYTLAVNVREITRQPEPAVVTGEPLPFTSGESDQGTFGGVSPIEVIETLQDPDDFLAGS